MESILGIIENEDKSISLFLITAINSTNGKNPTEYLKSAFMLEIGLVSKALSLHMQADILFAILNKCRYKRLL